MFFDPGPKVIKTFSMLNSAEHEIILLINVKMPIIVCILTFISMKMQHLRDLKQYTSSFAGILAFMSS